MKKWIVPGVLLIVLVSIMYNFNRSDDPESYREEITELREETERFMRYAEDSPFHDAAITFNGLRYYEPDLSYKITARFREIEDRQIITLPTNDNKKEEYLTYGYATFDVNDTTEEVLILENVEEEKFFLPFGDATSAGETYGAGRYLDVTHRGGRTIVLDFNKAYNPYCAYVETFSCPLPPRENLLSVAIRAGEKMYD
jgi:uncharacterized protein (DUF1684 family)